MYFQDYSVSRKKLSSLDNKDWEDATWGEKSRQVSLGDTGAEIWKWVTTYEKRFPAWKNMGT